MQVNPVITGQSNGPTSKDGKKPNNRIITREHIEQGVNLLKAVSRPTARYGLKTLKWLSYIGITSFALFKTPVFWKVTHDAVSKFDYYPTVKKWNETYTDKHMAGLPVDRFVANYQGFDKVLNSSNQLSLNSGILDANDNNIILDTSEEIERLISEFKNSDRKKYASEIKTLEEINAASRVIWDSWGPHMYDPVQGSRMNCPIMSDIQSHLLTDENTQILKGKIKVAKFNSSKENFQIDVVVDTGDGQIYIPYKDLIQWMSPREVTPSHSSEGTLYVPILTYAIEKGVNRYKGDVLKWLPSSTITVFSGENYVTMMTPTLSDEELKSVLMKAPQNPTKLVILQTKWSDLTVKNIFSDITELKKFLKLDKNYSYADYRENDFRDSIIRLLPPSSFTPASSTDSGDSGSTSPAILTTLPGSSTISPVSTTPTPLTRPVYKRLKTEEKYLLTNHVYTVKECKEVDGEWITTIIDANGIEADLTWEQLKRNGFAVVSQSENFPNIGKEGFLTLSICLASLLALRFGARKIDNYLKPIIVEPPKMLPNQEGKENTPLIT